MTTSRATTISSEVKSGDLSLATRAYFQSRLRNRLYNLVISNFRTAESAGLTRSELARRMGKRREIVTRLLSSPGNWTLDTVSDLLLATSGEELDITSSSPFKHTNRNYDAYFDGTGSFAADLNDPTRQAPDARTGGGILPLPPFQTPVAQTTHPMLAGR